MADTLAGKTRLRVFQKPAARVVLTSAEFPSEELDEERPIVPPPLDGEPDHLNEGTNGAKLPPDESVSGWIPEDAPNKLFDDELLLEGLARASRSEGSLKADPIDWSQFDPELPFETAPIFTFRDDLHDFLPNFFADTKSLFTWKNAVILGVGTGVALGLRENVDGEVRAWTAEHPERWGEGTEVLRCFGEYSYQVPILLGGYAWSLWRQDAPFHEFMKSTISSYALTSFTTVAIKGMTDTSRPTTEFEDGHYGFPSFHAASAFSIATNIETYYGWKAGLPAYALAGLVGWSRIDQREHDLSDVVFGSVLGYTIGKSVALAHQGRSNNWQVEPWYDPAQRAGGVSLDLRY